MHVKSRVRVRLGSLCAWLLLAAVAGVTGCAAKQPLPTLDDCSPCFRSGHKGDKGDSDVCRYCYEIRTRDPRKDALAHDYREEYGYIEGRRRQLDNLSVTEPTPPSQDASNAPPANLIGVALSGGGIRSASFGLGALQALNHSGVWNQTDYMSAVSGGGYLAGWVQAHLGQSKTFTRDEYYYEVRSEEPTDLLRNHGDHVEHLRTHTGFLNEGGWLEGAKMFGDWLWRWPFHLVLDDVLHLRGWFNFQHVLNVYQTRIEHTYMRGNPPADVKERPIARLPLEDVNAPKRVGEVPYLILGGNLTNRGKPETDISCVGRDCNPGQWNFEFTRDFVGSDATGYVDTRAYGQRVRAVVRDKTTERYPRAVVLSHHPDENSTFRGFEKGLGVSGLDRFELSSAMAASGAAFDSAAIAYQLDVPGLNELGQFVAGGIFNLYLGSESPNFARSERPAPIDYLYMMTLQRWPRLIRTDARWLYVTDGGHYENLGVLALLRRGVKCVLAFDASADPGRQYSDLDTLRTRVENDLGMAIVLPRDFPNDGNDPQGHYRLHVVKNGVTQAVILYVKSSADERLPHMLPGNALRQAQERIKRIRAREEKDLRALNLLANPKVRTVLSNYYDRLEREDDQDAKRQAELEEQLAGLRRLQDCIEACPLTEEGGSPPTSQCCPDRLPDESRDRDALKLKIEAKERELGRVSFNANWGVGDLEKKLADELTTAAAEPKVQADVLRKRARYAKQLANAREQRRYAKERDQERDDRIKKIVSYAHTSGSEGTFPHNNTLVEWYDWERFDAYRMLGYQEASTYLDWFEPDEPSNLQDAKDLAWCSFAPFYKADNVANQARAEDGRAPTLTPPQAPRH